MDLLLGLVMANAIEMKLDQEELNQFFTIFLEGLLMRNDNPRLIEVLRGILDILADTETD
jgi:hypothetical protein